VGKWNNIIRDHQEILLAIGSQMMLRAELLLAHGLQKVVRGSPKYQIFLCRTHEEIMTVIQFPCTQQLNKTWIRGTPIWHV
jgi:hypothetical protein